MGRYPDGSGTIVAFPGSASPGANNYLVSASSGLVLNEVMAKNVATITNASGAAADWIEIYNPGSAPFNVDSWSLSIDQQSAGQWYFPTGMTVPAQGYAIIWCDASRPISYLPGNLNIPHSISSESGSVYLFNAAGQLADSVEFGFQIVDLSIGRSGGTWRLLSAPTPGATNSPPAALGSVQNLRINEWLAAPSSGPDWFELYNLDSLPVNLGGVYLTDDPTLAGQTNSSASPLSFIPGKGWVKFIADGNISNGRDHVNFSLSDLGETLRIYSSNLALVDVVDFGVQFPDISQGRLLDGAAAIVNFPIPTPAEGNFLPLATLVINEALTHTDPPLEDAIELFNPTASTVDVGGWFISNSREDLKKYRIPNSTLLPPGTFMVFYENQFNANNPATPFTLNSARGDEIWISAADSVGNLTGYRASASFGPGENGVSFGRFATSLGPEYTAMAQGTFGVENPSTLAEFRTAPGAANSYAKVGPIVINEIMYHPPDNAGGDNTTDEFIELLNVSSSSVPLYDPAHATNIWRLQDGIDFTFPPGTSIAAGAYVLVVHFDPANAADLAAFRAKYSVPGGVSVFGPYQGKLDNGGEAIELVRPDAPQVPPHPDAGLIPYIRVDRVAYSDSVPWSSGADGNTNGLLISLQRAAPALYGNEPLNWVAGPATAGVTNSPANLPLPVITQQPQDRGGSAGATLTFSVTATGPEPLSYQWRVNGVPLQGAISSSLTIANVQLSDEGTYSVFVANPAGAVLSSSALLVVQAPPLITQQPLNQVSSPGASATFSVIAAGGGLSYRWLFYGTNFPGGAASTLALNNVQTAKAGPHSLCNSHIPGGGATPPADLGLNGPAVRFGPHGSHRPAGDSER